jgi:hypothetical protein
VHRHRRPVAEGELRDRWRPLCSRATSGSANSASAGSCGHRRDSGVYHVAKVVLNAAK